MSAQHRDVLVGRATEALSLEELAIRQGVPVGTVKSRLHHARRQLLTGCEAWLSPDAALCAELAAMPLALGWGLRSAASESVVRTHLASCAACAREWARLEPWAVLDTSSPYLLRTVVRVEADLGAWVEGDIHLEVPNAGVSVGTLVSAGRLVRVLDSRAREWSSTLRRVPAAGSLRSDTWCGCPRARACGSFNVWMRPRPCGRA